MSVAGKQYRLLTRSDFDGLVCAILLKELGILGEIKFVHPKDMQDGIIEVTSNDIVTNLPYAPNSFLCFDHHASELKRNGNLKADNYILKADADSAARVVYDYFGGKEAFPEISDEMMDAVDKADAAKFDLEDVLHPTGWELLSFIMDARTGLGRFHDFRVSNYQLMMDLIAYCKDHSIEEILALPDVEERVNVYRKQESLAKAQILRCSKVFGNVVVFDLREEEIIYATNRFMIYSLFPLCNLSIHVLWGKNREKTVFTIGKSIFDRTCATDVGSLCLRYHGGGHHAAGTCQVEHEDAERVLCEILLQAHHDAGLTATYN